MEIEVEFEGEPSDFGHLAVDLGRKHRYTPEGQERERPVFEHRRYVSGPLIQGDTPQGLSGGKIGTQSMPFFTRKPISHGYYTSAIDSNAKRLVISIVPRLLRPGAVAEVSARILPNRRAMLRIECDDESWPIVKPWWDLLHAKMIEEGWVKAPAVEPTEANSTEGEQSPAAKREQTEQRGTRAAGQTSGGDASYFGRKLGPAVEAPRLNETVVLWTTPELLVQHLEHYMEPFVQVGGTPSDPYRLAPIDARLTIYEHPPVIRICDYRYADKQIITLQITTVERHALTLDLAATCHEDDGELVDFFHTLLYNLRRAFKPPLKQRNEPGESDAQKQEERLEDRQALRPHSTIVPGMDWEQEVKPIITGMGKARIDWLALGVWFYRGGKDLVTQSEISRVIPCSREDVSRNFESARKQL